MQAYLIAQGKPFEIIHDIGSGINYKNKGLQELLRLITQNEVEKVVVLYQYRLLRFGYELIEYMIQIFTVFSARLQGRRANKTKQMIKELIEDDPRSKN